MTRTTRVFVAPLTIQPGQPYRRYQSAETALFSAAAQKTASDIQEPSPEWKSPNATSAASLSALCSAFLPPQFEPTFSPSVEYNTFSSPTSWTPEIPTEIWDNIAHECLGLGEDSTPTLLALSSTCKATHYPAQRALVRHLDVQDPIAIEELMTSLLRKPALGRATKSLTVNLMKPQSNSRLENSQAQEVALLGLLPLVPRITHVRLQCEFDCPESLIQLLTATLKNVKSITICSAFGYNRLVYITDSTLTRLNSGFPKLESLSLIMPWVLPDPKGTQFAIGQTSAKQSSLRSLEISGFRGSPQSLKNALLGPCSQTLKRFCFDCPIDEEPWLSMHDLLKPLNLELEELSLWSWTMEMPVKQVVSNISTKSLKSLTMVSTALDETLTSRLPLGLEKLTLCSHPEFAPLEQTSVGQKVISRPQKAALHDLSVYNPSNESVDLEELTKTLSKRSIQCSRIQNDVEGA